MSWLAASLILLTAALGGGFVWYERSHPSSHTVALVATLAALATIGRIAFAALPNVKPTTDIVLIAGYTLGGAPGFAVGAVTALASNFFFGQGPWTPWQMFAWGIIGVAGAGLARISRRRLGRIPMAIACGVAGMVFGLILDLSTWVTFTGAHTFDQYIVIEGQALTFNIAHAVGNIVFFLAFGPALIRALLRFRARMDVRWIPVAAALMLLAAAPVIASAAGGRGGALAREASYLTAAQNPDGGFGSAAGDGASQQLYTAWAMIGLGAANDDPAGRLRGVHFMLAHASALRGAGDLERTILAIRSAGITPAPALVTRLERLQHPDGSFDDQVDVTAFGILALRAARAPVGGAPAWLAAQQNPDGGFNFNSRGGQSGVDDTAAAVQGLVAGGSVAGVARAGSFIAGAENADGGFPLNPGGDSNAQSTGWAAQGLLAAGRDPAVVSHGRVRSPLGYLESLTQRDGSVDYARGNGQSPVWVTAEALPALAQRPFPIFGAKPHAAPAPIFRAPPAAAPANHQPVSHHPAPRRRSRSQRTATANGARSEAAAAEQIQSVVLAVSERVLAIAAW